MMTRTEKTEQILQIVQAKMPDTKIEPIEVEKNNKQKRKGIHIHIPGDFQGICIYWDSIFEICARDSSIEKMADCICEMSKEAMKTKINQTLLLDWEKVKSMIYKKVINYKRNQDRLSAIPHQRYLDLAEVFYARIPLSDRRWGTCEVTHELLQTWEISKQELAEQAERNMREEHYQMLPLEQVLRSLGMSVCEGLEHHFYVIKNQRNEFSANVISNPKQMKEFMDQIGGDSYLLPSSVEELLVIPVKEGSDTAMLKTMIKEVNQECVSPNEFLSDQLYYCHRSSGEVEIYMESKEE